MHLSTCNPFKKCFSRLWSPHAGSSSGPYLRFRMSFRYTISSFRNLLYVPSIRMQCDSWQDNLLKKCTNRSSTYKFTLVHCFSPCIRASTMSTASDLSVRSTTNAWTILRLHFRTFLFSPMRYPRVWSTFIFKGANVLSFSNGRLFPSMMLHNH